MQKNEVINGYRILEDFKVAGGMSKVSFAEKDGKEFFIKEFLSPKYPMPDSAGSEKVKSQKRKACDVFEKHHRDLNTAIDRCCAGMGGNLIYAIDFFRNGASYYKVTEKVDITNLPCEAISKLPMGKILLIAKSAIHSIKILHGQKIVHGDLKPDNLLVKEASKGYVVKLIDFDDSYFEGNPPADRENLVGTPEYYSPEQAAYIMDEDEEIEGSTLTCMSDVFTLGIILCEYFTGVKPILTGAYKNTWECVANGGGISFKIPIHVELDSLIRKMLSLNPNDRPDINEVFNILKNLELDEDAKVASPVPKKGRPIMRGKGLPKPTPSIPATSHTSTEPKFSSTLRGSGLKIADK